jgi:predicted MPP superfamily phosphohydrolase
VKAVIIGDTHFPWVDWKLLRETIDFIDDFGPGIVIQMGDLFDFYSFSRYARTLNLCTPKWEVKAGREGAEEMWSLIQSAAPRAKCYQLRGNHDERVAKQVLAKFPEAEALLDLLDYDKLWRFDGVKTMKSQSEELILNGDHMRHNLMNTVTGHSHHGGVTTMRYRGKSLWELNAGAVADMKAKPLKYGLNNKLTKSVLGFGVIDKHGPRFIPY